MMLPLYASLERLDPRLLEAGGDLYAKPFTAFRKVTWPLSLPGVVAGTLLTFIPAAGDYINSKLLGNTLDDDDRAGHRRPVPARPRLPDRGGAVVHPDADDPGHSSRSTSAGPGPRSWSDGSASPPAARRPPSATASSRAVRSPGCASTSSRSSRCSRSSTCCSRTSSSSCSRSTSRPAASTTTWSQLLDRRLDQRLRCRRGSATRSALSLKIGLIATLGATILGTMVAFALGRHRFRGRSATNLLIFMPMATPEVVMGSTLLTLFVGIGIPLGGPGRAGRARARRGSSPGTGDRRSRPPRARRRRARPRRRPGRPPAAGPRRRRPPSRSRPGAARARAAPRASARAAARARAKSPAIASRTATKPRTPSSAKRRPATRRQQLEALGPRLRHRDAVDHERPGDDADGRVEVDGARRIAASEAQGRARLGQAALRAPCIQASSHIRQRARVTPMSSPSPSSATAASSATASPAAGSTDSGCR